MAMFVLAEFYGLLLSGCLLYMALTKRRMEREFEQVFGVRPPGRRNKGRTKVAPSATTKPQTPHAVQHLQQQPCTHKWVGCMTGDCPHEGECPWPRCAKCGEYL